MVQLLVQVLNHPFHKESNTLKICPYHPELPIQEYNAVLRLLYAIKRVYLINPVTKLRQCDT